MYLALNYQRVEPNRGGAETYVADLCRRLAERGHRIDLYAETWSREHLPREANIVPVKARGRTRLERLWSFARNSEVAMREGGHDCSIGFINTWAHDVIVPQGGVQEGSLNANSQRFQKGLQRGLYRLSKSANPKYWVHRAIESRQYGPQWTSRFVAVSQMVRDHLERFHQIPRELIDVVPNAIDLARVDVAHPGAVRCAFRNRLGLGPADLTGLFVGHNFALKGLGPLLEALGARRRDRLARPIHLLVSGGGSTAPFARLARSLGLRDHVHFLGFHPDVRECYWSSDFFVQPTYYDPCSLVVLEALACGLPAITTRQNGAGELMTEGREGHVISAPDAEAELLRALDHMTDDSARVAMAEAARRLGREWTFDDHVDRLVEILQRAARARKARESGQRPSDGAGHGHAAHRPHLGRTRRTTPSRTNMKSA